MNPKARFIKERFLECFKEVDKDEFNKDSQLVPFHVAYEFDEILRLMISTGDAWERLYSNVLESLGRSKFIIPEIRKAIILRNALKR